MGYIDGRLTRVWVHPTWRATDGAPDPENLAMEGWEMVRGARSDQAQSTPNTQEFYHYGEPDAVTTSSPPTRTVTVPASEDLYDEGQSILRWAAEQAETIGFLMIKDNSQGDGYAVEATVVMNDESGEAQGGLRTTGFTITPLGTRVYVGESGIYDPGS